jgi:acetolactate synthase regulatory subunit
MEKLRLSKEMLKKKSKQYLFALLISTALQTSSSKTVKHNSLQFSKIYDKTSVKKCQIHSQVGGFCIKTMHFAIQRLLR